LQIENQSPHRLSSVALVERTSREAEQGGATPALRGMWIGNLLAGESKPALFSLPVAVKKDAAPFADERVAEERLQNGPRLGIESMFRLALDVNSLEPGEKRLVARIDEVLPGEQASPAASQVRVAVLVVAHLDYGPRPEPLPDRNTRFDVERKVDEFELDVESAP
jgi:hypothetical protein